MRLSPTLRRAAVAAVCLMALSAAPAHAEGQLRIGVLEEIGTLNPYASGNATEEQLWALVYDTLVTRSRNTLEPDPDRSLARAWTVTDGGKRWTFKLASDVRWSDGRRFTADDVVYSMRLAAEPGSPFAGALRNVRSWRALDSLTVEATLSQRVPDLDRLPVPIVPAHIWRNVPRPLVASLDAPLVVTGPYYVSTHDSTGRTVLARNPAFRHVNTGPDRVVFLRYRNSSELAPALERGEIDVAHLTAASQAAAISPIPGVRTYRALAPSVTFLVFDERTDDGSPAVGDPALRKALGHAIDRDKLVERALGGLGQPGTFGLLPPFYGAASSDLSRDRRLPLAYDRARARAMLDGAGWHTGRDGVRVRDGVRASLVLSVQAERPSDLRTAVLLEQMARHVGIEIRLNLLGPAVLSRGRDMPDDQVAQADASLVTVRGEPTPDSLLAAFASGSSDALNAAHWGDASYDALLAQQSSEPRRARIGTLRNMQRLVVAGAPVVALYSPDRLTAVSTARWDGWSRSPEQDGLPLSPYSYEGVLALRARPDDPRYAGPPLLLLSLAGAAAGGAWLWFRSRRKLIEQPLEVGEARRA